ncbi:MAG: hypothetical protein HW374_2017, partial [Bacteroidetes bacterium]|nr:hypothetical protein [Bacteroidota bacterium]
KVLGRVQPPPSVPQGDRDRFLGILLADDVFVKFSDDLARCQLA